MRPDVFYVGRMLPDADPDSSIGREYVEQEIYRSINGYEVNGTRITGDHYWYLNHYPASIVDIQGNINPGYSIYTNADDWIFKQLEEADDSDLAALLLSGRGIGKTAIVTSMIHKRAMIIKNRHSIWSATSSDRASSGWTYLRFACAATNMDPFFRKNVIRSVDEIVQLGDKIGVDGQQSTDMFHEIHNIWYDKTTGKTRGKQPIIQVFEECGSWDGAAKLKDCWAQTKGSLERVGVRTGFAIFIGTGGEMRSGGSEDFKEMYYNPEAFGIYGITDYSATGNKKGIFVPCYKKHMLSPGIMETGMNDDNWAKGFYDNKRQTLQETDMDEYYKHIQEHPFEDKEAFYLQGGTLWDIAKINMHKMRIDEELKHAPIMKRGDLFWKKESGRIVGVEWCESKTGKIQIVEPPVLVNNEVLPKLYIGGCDSYDSIDGKSNGSFFIKKRMMSSQETNNIYVCQYTDRPDDPNTFYENCLKICWWFNAQVNIEQTRTSIINYFKYRNMQRFLMQKPKIAYTDNTVKLNKNIYGTPVFGKGADGKILKYGLEMVQNYLRLHLENLYFSDLLDELIQFNVDDRGKFDRVMAFIMTEIADDDLYGEYAKVAEKILLDIGGFKTVNGIKRPWGSVSNKHEEVKLGIQETLRKSLENGNNNSI
jgi:hypothetical protein